MKAIQLSKVISTSARAAQSAALKSTAVSSQKKLSVIENEDGIQFASLPEPNNWKGLTRLAIIFNAGARHEKAPNMLGISHLIRRSCGLSTTNYTAVNLTRHIQQMGGQIQCQTSREHLIYTVDVAPNLAQRAGHILATVATRTAFYDWELKDLAYKYMRKDIDLLNRRQFDVLTIDLLHDAAFGQHPSGTGLGNSLYAGATRVGSHSIVDIEAFLADHLTPANVSFITVGSGASVDGVELCEAMKEAAHLRPDAEHGQPVSRVAKHGFVGGERRREMTGANVSHAALAWPTVGRASPDNCMALSICASALTAPLHSIAYGATESLLLPSKVADSGVCATPLHYSYADHGLFGLLISGGDAKAVADNLVAARGALGELAAKGLTSVQFERAKSRFKSQVLMRAENQSVLTEDIAVQLMDRAETVYRSPEEICSAVDALKLADVNAALKGALESSKLALATVGSDIAYVPPVDTLLSA